MCTLRDHEQNNETIRKSNTAIDIFEIIFEFERNEKNVLLYIHWPLYGI